MKTRYTGGMRSGDYTKLLFSQNGNLIAISTGSDCCTEHEWGIANIMSDLCDRDNPRYSEKHRITKTPPELRFINGGTSEFPEAILSFSKHAVDFDHHELTLNTYYSFADKDAISAWCDSEFAIRVRGEEVCKGIDFLLPRYVCGQGDVCWFPVAIQQWSVWRHHSW